LGERLLCKQEVVGSIPSASMAVLWGPCFGGWAVSSRKRWRFGLHGLASPLLGGAGCCVARWVVFFVDCESGSGASLDAQDVSVGFGGFVLFVGAVRFGAEAGGP